MVAILLSIEGVWVLPNVPARIVSNLCPMLIWTMRKKGYGISHTRPRSLFNGKHGERGKKRKIPTVLNFTLMEEKLFGIDLVSQDYLAPGIVLAIFPHSNGQDLCRKKEEAVQGRFTTRLCEMPSKTV